VDASDVQLRSREVPLPGGPRLHVVELGDQNGPAVVLVHGWPDSWFSWSRVLPHLDPRWHVVVPDLRGFGDSGTPPTGYTVDDLAGDVVALADALGLTGRTSSGTPWAASSSGGSPNAIPTGVQDRLLAALPDARLRVHPDTGHCPNWERPEEVAADLVDFLTAKPAGLSRRG
jgi:pimeloyl-ACP methyl ester carboxylesterase